MEVFVSPTDLQEKNNFCFLYKITICKVAPLCEILFFILRAVTNAIQYIQIERNIY